MRIRKIANSYMITGKVNNELSTSTEDTYSCNYINGTVLYENSNGATSNVTLSDEVENYKYLEVFGGTSDGYETIKIDITIKQRIEFLAMYADSSVFVIKVSDYVFSGTSMTRVAMYSKYDNGTFDISNENDIKIYKIIGYK